MARNILLIFALAFLTLSPIARNVPAGATSLGSQDPDTLLEPSVAGEARSILDNLYRGKSDLALEQTERYIEANQDHPLPYLIKARVLREALPEQDDNKELIRKNAAPMHDILDKVIDLCETRMKAAEDDSEHRFYRGWAWMFKAQLHALGGSYWSAGRSAAKGNQDLKKYLSEHPEDPDAKGIMGTFLYFADTLPAVIKFVKTLFFIPGGDREKGLAYLNDACAEGGLLATDHKIILAAIYTLFEGRFEDGVSRFMDLLEKYPSYLRLVEPLGVVRTFYPSKLWQLMQIENSALDRHMAEQREGVDWDTIHRLRYHRSYSSMFFESPSAAIQEFRALVDEAPDRPDWLVPLSLMNLGCIYANLGEADKATDACNRILEDKGMKRFHDVAEEMLEGNHLIENSILEADAGFIRHIYILEQAWAKNGLEDYRERKGATVLYDFYSGEALLLAGDLEEASNRFLSALDQEVPSCSQAYQLLSAVRLAEIKGVQQDYKSAEKYLDKSLDYYHEEFLIDMLIKARKRFYERLSKGESDITPSVLVYAPRTLD
ncbi:MAG: hypothetical protein GTO51_08370 [Candidatus Latescibacteria bacterium]|nr:hypothetical protein [Candidatus Latescibacterota bacterium]NIM21967.1 hypothetical protein [Candidatus Latescibacterota bacterium]NIM65985.1 hypothetical protein [Candidatus Latescibacterota bacterium]NIO02393.1 hypothetical protein [Candidatus Latescibacterota bacterium]NIO29303.1 hypothetical protein [Candidatus Latescibacterota bacterium]